MLNNLTNRLAFSSVNLLKRSSISNQVWKSFPRVDRAKLADIRLISSSSSSLSKTYRDTDPGKVYVRFHTAEGDMIQCEAEEGQHLLEVAHQNQVELEGACEASLACSTCHVILDDERQYDKLPEPSDDENDMLDLAFGLTDTSRLGCQVYLDRSTLVNKIDKQGNITKVESNGNLLLVRIPSATRNMAVDGYKPKPH